MAWFSENAETYKIEIVDPDDEAIRATVTCKRLTAGDHADIVDVLFDEERGEGGQRLLIVERAVVGWTLPEAYTPAMLSGLKPEVFLQIYAGIKDVDVNPFAPAARLAASLKREEAATTGMETPAPAEPAADDAASQSS